MTEQKLMHTAERLIAATAISSVVGLPIVGQDGRSVASVTTVPSGFPNAEVINAESLANARRLAACWNACQDIGTEELEARSFATPHFQQRAATWMDACFGPIISADKVERNHRFLEEALELVQACGATREECHQLVEYVFGRPIGEPNQESGGVSVTHAALCLANGIDMHEAAEVELTRVWRKIDVIREKQAAKPRGSALPVSPSYEAKTSSGAV